jgi:predicted RND superfamily exporter protein
VVGTFGRTLLAFTIESVPLSLACYLVTAVVCSLLLGNLNDYVRSRMALGMYGCIVAVIAFSGALGLTCLCNIKLNIVQTWTLPFLMVGLGMDDMFILALAADVFFSKEENKRNGRHSNQSAEDIFVEAYEHVSIPVSLTSVVNASMFSIMCISDIPAVQLTAVSAVISVILLYITMMTSFAAAIVLDFKRQISNHNDVMCCFENINHALAKVKPAVAKAGKVINEEDKDDDDESQTLPNLKHFLWDHGYEPMMRSLSGRVVILVLALVVFILSCVGMSMMEVGLGLEEFFPNNSMGYRFSILRSQYFPAWPAQINYGQVIESMHLSCIMYNV